MAQKIKKAVLAVAGLGSRVMPLTLHQPKGMIGIVDRPIIHYVVDEILAAGIRQIVFVISPGHHQFEQYLKYLNEKDPEWGKKGIQFDFVVQDKPIGNGDAILLAKKIVKKEPFLVAFGDDILADRQPPLKKMVEFFEKTAAPIIALEKVPKDQVFRYGVVKAKRSVFGLYKIEDVVEKPKVEEAPSNLTIIGRYILTPDILDQIEKLYPYRGKEIWLADALKNHARSGKNIYGWLFKGERFDGGSKLGILKAQAYFGARHESLGSEFRKYLKKL